MYSLYQKRLGSVNNDKELSVGWDGCVWKIECNTFANMISFIT